LDIRDAKVNWNDDWANDPQLVVLVDRIPKREELVYEVVHVSPHTCLYFSIHEGYVSYLYEDDRNRRGYGGDTFWLNVKGVGRIGVKGPWSSRASVVYKLTGIPVVDVAMTNSKESYERGFTLQAGCITWGAAIQAAKIADVVLEEDVKYDEITFIPRKECPQYIHQLPRALQLLAYCYKGNYEHMEKSLRERTEEYFSKYYGNKWQEKLDIQIPQKGELH
jgi:hypothetical protein